MSNCVRTAPGLGLACELTSEARADISAAYNSILEAKVAALEGVLKEKGVDMNASASEGSHRSQRSPSRRSRHRSSSHVSHGQNDVAMVNNDVPADIDAGVPSPLRNDQDGREVFQEADRFPKAAAAPFAPPSALSNHTAFATPTEPAEQSFGTLVITESGRSKWLGPTAASDWLKDVS